MAIEIRPFLEYCVHFKSGELSPVWNSWKNSGHLTKKTEALGELEGSFKCMKGCHMKDRVVGMTPQDNGLCLLK